MAPQSCPARCQWIVLSTRVCTSKALHISKGCRKGGRARTPESATRKVLEMSLILGKFTSGQVDVGVTPSQTYLTGLVCSLMRLRTDLSGDRIAQKSVFLVSQVEVDRLMEQELIVWVCVVHFRSAFQIVLAILRRCADSYLSRPTFLQYVK